MTSLTERLGRLDPERRRYTLNTLAEHLGEAGQSQRLRDLFVDDQWMRARVEDSGGVYDGFLSDTTMSLTLEQRRGRLHVDDGGEPIAIADVFRLALIRTRVSSVVFQVRPSLVIRALDLRLWTVARALNVATKKRQLELYTALLAGPYLTADQRDRVLDAALAVVLERRDDSLAGGLELLGPHLDQQHAGRALTAVEAIADGGYRVRALAGIAGAVDVRRRTDALTRELERVRTTPGWKQWDAIMALRGLAIHLDGLLLESALAVADVIEQDAERSETFAILAGRKGDRFQRLCLERVLATSEEAQHKALIRMIPGLTGAVFDEAMAAALRMNDGYYRAKVIGAAAAHLPPGLLPAAVDSGLACEWDQSRRDVVVALSGRLDGVLLRRVFDYALKEPRADYRTSMLLALLPRLDGDAKTQAIVELKAVAGPFDLARLAAHVEEHEQDALLAKAFDAVPGPDAARVSTRAGVLRTLIEDLPRSHLGQALALARSLGDEKEFAEILQTLAPLAGLDLLSTIVDAALALGEERGRTVERIAPYLSAELLTKVLDHVHQVDDFQERGDALLSLLSGVSPDQRAAVVPWAERAIRKSRYDVAQRLASLAAYVLDADKDTVLDAAMERVAGMTDEWQRSSAIRGLASYLRPRQVASALDIARNLPQTSTRARALTAIIPMLGMEDRDHVVSEALRSAWTSCHELYDLSRLASPAQRAEVLDRALELAERILPVSRERFDNDDAEALVAALASIPDFVDEVHVARVLQLAYRIPDERFRANALARVAPLLDEGQLAQAVEDVKKMADAAGRVSVLVELVPWLSETLLEYVESLTMSLESSDWFRDRMLLSIVQSLPSESLERGRKLADAVTDGNLRSRAWAVLARRLRGERRTEAVTRAIEVAAHAGEPSLDQLDDFLPLTDNALVVQHARRTLLVCLASVDSNTSVMGACRHVARLASPAVAAHVAHHLVDVCWNWRWP